MESRVVPDTDFGAGYPVPNSRITDISTLLIGYSTTIGKFCQVKYVLMNATFFHLEISGEDTFYETHV